MVYKKYTWKKGKKYGPYLYESKRVGNKVLSRYIGRIAERKRKLSLFGLQFNFAFWGVILLTLFFVFALRAASGDEGNFPFGTLAFSDNGSLVQNLNDCGTLSTANAVFTANQNIGSVGTCLTVSAGNITINGNGFTLNYTSDASGASAVNVTNVNFTVIKNFIIIMTNHTSISGTAIDFVDSSNGTIQNNTINSLRGNGISLDISSNSNTVIYNIINSTSTGVVFGSVGAVANNNNVTANNLTVMGSGQGMQLSKSSFNYIALNHIMANGTGDRGITFSLNGSSSNIIDSNIIQTNGTTSNSSVYGANGISIEIGSSSNIFTYNNISAWSPLSAGVGIQADSQYNQFTSLIINNTGGDAIFLMESTVTNAWLPINNNFTNITIINTNSSRFDFNISSSINGTYIIDSVIANYTIIKSGSIFNFKSVGLGEIRFLQPINDSGSNLSADVRIANNLVFVNDSKTGLNKSANITLYNLQTGFINPKIFRDAGQCSSSICTAFTSLNAGNVSFNVTGWSNYSILDVDTIVPLVQFVSPTNTSGIVTKETSFAINVTASDTNLVNITMQLFNSSGSRIRFNSSTTSPLFVNVSALGDGRYFFNATAFDVAGNTNSTETRNVTVDTISPLVSIAYPANTTYNIAITALNVSVSDVNLGSCWYTVNGSLVNTTITCGTNVTGLSSTEGNNTWITYVNDTAGNTNSSTIIFRVDTTVTYCQVLGTANTVYTQTANIIPTVSPCFNVTAQNVTFNGNGFFISNTTGAQGAIGIYTDQFNTTIKNTNITISAVSFSGEGISSLYATSALIINNTITNSNSIGIDSGGSDQIINNTISLSGTGISFSGFFGKREIIKGNNITESRNLDISYSPSDCDDVIENNTGSGGRLIGYYNDSTNIVGQVFSELILCNADYSNITNVNVTGSSTLFNNGVILRLTDNANFTGNNVSRPYIGFDLSSGDNYNDTFANNKVSNASGQGFSISGDNHIFINNSQSGTRFFINAANNLTFINNNLGAGDISSMFNSTFINNSFDVGDPQPLMMNGALHNIFNSTVIGAATVEWINTASDSYDNNFTDTLFNSSSGGIRIIPTFSMPANWTSMTPDFLSITDNNAFLNSSNMSFLNLTANVTLVNVPIYGQPVILKDGVACTNCSNFTALTAGTVVFNVTSWSSYSIGDLTNPLVTIIFPTNTTYTSLPLNFNVTLNENGTVSYSLNSGINNVTMFSTNGMNFNSSNSSLAAGSYRFRVYASDIAGSNNFTTFVDFTLDANPPNGTLINPSNNTINNTTTHNFTATLTDNLGIKNATLNIYNTSGLFNSTFITYGAGVISATASAVVALVDGIFKWFYQVYDWAGNTFTTQNNTLTVDTTSPNITQMNDLIITYNEGFGIKVNATDTNIGTFSINWTTPFAINSSGFLQNTTKLWADTYKLNVSVNDSALNVNSTMFTLVVNKANSTLNTTINGTQANITITRGANLSLNGSIILGDGAIFAVLNSSTINNGTSPLGNMTSFNTAGLFNFSTFYLASQNYTASALTYWITVLSSDSTPPLVTINSPINSTYSTSSVIVNISINENGTCFFSLDSGATNATLTNGANRQFTGSAGAFSNGGRIINAYCNDTAGNTNYSTFIAFSINVPAGGGGNGGFGGGSGGSGGGVVCTPSYSCSDWSVCTNGKQARSCTDIACGGSKDEERTCLLTCVPDWQCNAWSACANGESARSCTDKNNCGSSEYKPAETLSCSAKAEKVVEKSCVPNFECSDWGECNYGSKIDDIFNGRIAYNGHKERECEDISGCANRYTDESYCQSFVKIEFKVSNICGQETLIALNSETKKPITDINLDSWKNKKLDISFVQSENVSCFSCYNGIKDGNETGIDCGGSCRICLVESNVPEGLLVWPWWLLLLLLVIIYFWDKRRREEANVMHILKELKLGHRV